MLTFSTVFGGVGIFILGMIMMTDGLKSLAGDSLKKYLSKFTGGHFSAITTGAVITAILQSSSATTLLTIGFVSAGFLTFVQAFGVIIGANIGSTSTGWIVSTLGLKLNLSLVTFPMVGAGVFLKLFSKGKYEAQGTALAGFALIFVGIDILQQGMVGLAEVINFGAFVDDTFFNRILLLLIGIAMTIIMQSSSAAVATTLVALDSGALLFSQAAVLVIGQNVGTTFKAALAAAGGSVLAKRTATGHILFNLLTGLAAFIMLPVFILLLGRINQLFGINDPTVELALFHTMFNFLGLLLIMPFISKFSAFITGLVPDKGEKLVKHLDPSVAEVVPIAVEASRKTLQDILNALLEKRYVLNNKNVQQGFHDRMCLISTSIQEVRDFLGRIKTDKSHSNVHEAHLSIIHGTNHLERFVKNFSDTKHLETIYHDDHLSMLSSKLLGIMDKLQYQEDLDSLIDIIEENSHEFAQLRKNHRTIIIEQITQGKENPHKGLSKIDAYVWLDRLAYHLWRLAFHLSERKTDSQHHVSSKEFEVR